MSEDFSDKTLCKWADPEQGWQKDPRHNACEDIAALSKELLEARERIRALSTPVRKDFAAMDKRVWELYHRLEEVDRKLKLRDTLENPPTCEKEDRRERFRDGWMRGAGSRLGPFSQDEDYLHGYTLGRAAFAKAMSATDREIQGL